MNTLKSYKNTTVNWGRSQIQIQELLEKRQAKDVRFTNISHETAEQGGLIMERNTSAIMVEFFKLRNLDGGVAGKVPVRIIIPNVPVENERVRNQMYRLLFWYLKNKFDAVDTGLVDFEQEFLPHLMIKDKSGFVGTVWQALKKPYEAMIGSGETDLLNALPAPKKEEE